MPQTTTKPRIGLLMGDPCGVGPEILFKMLSDATNHEKAHVVVIGDRRVWDKAAATTKLAFPVWEVKSLDSEWHRHTDSDTILFLQGPQIDPSSYQQGQVSAEAGRYVLDTSRVALELAQTGHFDGVCFAPFNKQSMHLAGSPFEDDLRYFAHLLEFEEYVGELNFIDDLWSARVTSHVPLKEVADLITEENIEPAVVLMNRSLRRAGIDNPRIAVAALNPHAGEGGLFGSEEIDVIQPLVERLSATMNVMGPYPSDTVFLRAKKGDFDAVVTMYHDQGQVAMKLMGFSRGVTVHGGLPVVVTTPAHGTAFDIVGTGLADPSAMAQAFGLACKMATQ